MSLFLHYRGPFLKGVAVDDSPEFDEWLLLVRERYQRLAGQALRTLATGYEHRGQHGRALDYARKCVQLEPWEEEAHRQIMRLHLAAGDRNAALSQFDACRQVLAAELAVEPSAATTSLYRRILTSDSGEPSTVSWNNLPTPLTPLIGRADELATVKALLVDPSSRFITLTGPGGGGKTRLAIEAAGQMIQNFAQGVTFVSLASVTEPDAIAPALAQALGFSLAGQASADTQLIDYLRHRQCLLVLDNFEHLIDGLPLVHDILTSASDVKVLVTSRVRLNIPGEQVILLPGLAVPQLDDDARDVHAIELVKYGSVSLFLYHVHRIRADYEPTPTELNAILRICRLASGMPLAIMLAAAWMNVLTPEEIAARLVGVDDSSDSMGLALLETDSPGLPERQRSMRRVFDETWSLLPSQEQRQLAALSIFRGGFSYEASRAVAKTTLRQIKSCVDRSLLQRQPDGLYEIHELLRQFAFSQLVEQGNQQHVVRERHAIYFADEAFKQGKQLGGRDQLAAIKQMATHADNIRVALEWMIENARLDLIDRTVDGLFAFYDWRGYLQLADNTCRTIFSRFLEPWPRSDQRLHARLLTWHGRFLRRLGQVDEAQILLDRALSVLNRLESSDVNIHDARATALVEMGILHKDSDRERTDRLYGQSLTLYSKTDNRSGTANVLYRRGSLAADRGEYEPAHRLLSESLTLCQDLGDNRRTAVVLDEMAIVYAIQGRSEESERMGRQAADIHEKLGDRYRRVTSMLELASRSAYAGQFQRALTLFERCSAAFEELGARILRASSVHLMGWMNVNLGNLEEAEIQYHQAQRVFDEIGNERGQGVTFLGMGELFLMRGDDGRAVDYLKRAVHCFEALCQEDEFALSCAALAHAQRESGDHDGAQRSVRLALTTVQRIGAFAPAYMAIASQSLLLADQGDLMRAIEYHALVMSHPYFGNSRFRQTVTGRHIDRFAAALPANAVRAAQEQGRMRDIWSTVDEVMATYEGVDAVIACEHRYRSKN